LSETTTWQLLFVDDDAEICEIIKEFLEGERIQESEIKVETLTEFKSAMNELEKRRYDLIILDVKLQQHNEKIEDNQAGINTLNEIRQRRFIPVIFYTGLPHLVNHLEDNLIKVVTKGPETENLMIAVNDIFATRLPVINRAIIRHVESIQRDYMWDFVLKHWEQFQELSDGTELAYLLARRLALSLSGPEIQQFSRELGGELGTSMPENKVHPVEYYVMPPINASPLTGDLYCKQNGDVTDYWILLTPSCDLVKGREKADHVLMAHCDLLSVQEEYEEWKTSLPEPKKAVRKKLKHLLENSPNPRQQDRFQFLPGAFILPDLLVDFQQIRTVTPEKLDEMERVASLYSPFAEALLSRFVRYFGRLGTPDLDIDCVCEKLRRGCD